MVKGVFVRFFNYKITLSVSILYSLELVHSSFWKLHTLQEEIGRGEIKLYLSEGRVCTYIIQNSSVQKPCISPLIIFSIIYLCRHELRYIYFILWIIIQSIWCLNYPSTGHWETLQVRSCFPLICSHFFFFFSTNVYFLLLIFFSGVNIIC